MEKDGEAFLSFSDGRKPNVCHLGSGE